MFKIWEYRPWKIVVAYLIGILVLVLNTPLKDRIKELFSYPIILAVIPSVLIVLIVSYFISKDKSNSKTWKK